MVKCNPVSLCNPNQSVYPVGKWEEVQSEICDGEKKKGPLAYVLKSALAPLTSFVSAFLAWLDALMPLLLLAYFSIEPCCLNLSGGRKEKMACCYSVCRRIELAHTSPPKSWCEMSWCQWVHPDPLQQPQKTLQSVNSKQACSSSVCGPSIQSAGAAVSNFCLWVGRRWT